MGGGVAPGAAWTLRAPPGIVFAYCPGTSCRGGASAPDTVFAYYALQIPAILLILGGGPACMRMSGAGAALLGIAAAAVLAASVPAAGGDAAALPLAYAHPHPGTTLASSFSSPSSHPHEARTETTALSAGIGLERTSLYFHAPADNALPWGYVEGRVDNPVPGHPVIIQMHAADGSAVHFAQVDTSADGAYEYKFRVRNVGPDGAATHLFSGDYAVTVYKVVYLSGQGHA